MKYLKVWTSFRKVIEPLTDAEKGRLFVMMMVYAETFEEPTEFVENERILWPAAKQVVDLAYEESLRLSRNGKKGGRPAETNEKQDEPTETNEKQNKPTESQKEKKRKEKKGNEKENINFSRFWAVYPRKVAKPAALRQFIAIDPDEELLQKMLSVIERSKKSEQWTKDGGQFIPYPATWLHQRRWEDDSAVLVKVLPAQDFEQRSYEGVDRELMEDLAREMADFKKGAV